MVAAAPAPPPFSHHASARGRQSGRSVDKSAGRSVISRREEDGRKTDRDRCGEGFGTGKGRDGEAPLEEFRAHSRGGARSLDGRRIRLPSYSSSSLNRPSFHECRVKPQSDIDDADMHIGVHAANLPYLPTPRPNVPLGFDRAGEGRARLDKARVEDAPIDNARGEGLSSQRAKAAVETARPAAVNFISWPSAAARFSSPLHGVTLLAGGSPTNAPCLQVREGKPSGDLDGDPRGSHERHQAELRSPQSSRLIAPGAFAAPASDPSTRIQAWVDVKETKRGAEDESGSKQSKGNDKGKDMGKQKEIEKEKEKGKEKKQRREKTERRAKSTDGLHPGSPALGFMHDLPSAKVDTHSQVHLGLPFDRCIAPRTMVYTSRSPHSPLIPTPQVPHAPLMPSTLDTRYRTNAPTSTLTLQSYPARRIGSDATSPVSPSSFAQAGQSFVLAGSQLTSQTTASSPKASRGAAPLVSPLASISQRQSHLGRDQIGGALAVSHVSSFPHASAPAAFGVEGRSFMGEPMSMACIPLPDPSEATPAIAGKRQQTENVKATTIRGLSKTETGVEIGIGVRIGSGKRIGGEGGGGGGADDETSLRDIVRPYLERRRGLEEAARRTREPRTKEPRTRAPRMKAPRAIVEARELVGQNPVFQSFGRRVFEGGENGNEGTKVINGIRNNSSLDLQHLKAALEILKPELLRSGGKTTLPPIPKYIIVTPEKAARFKMDFLQDSELVY